VVLRAKRLAMPDVLARPAQGTNHPIIRVGQNYRRTAPPNAGFVNHEGEAAAG
jgi:hypothetical protein